MVKYLPIMDEKPYNFLMKKGFLIIILTVFCLYSSFAVSADRILIGTGNDTFNYGWSRNDDDQLSFSGNLEAVFDNLSFYLDFNAFTNRGWKTDWDPQDETVSAKENDSIFRGRCDQIEVSSAFNHSFTIESMDFDAKLLAGLSLSGNFNFAYAQNLLHKTAGIHNVSLPYDYDNVLCLPVLGGSLTYSKDLFLNTALTATVSAKLTPGLNAFETFELAAKIRNYLSLSLSYRFGQSISDSLTEKLYTAKMSGFSLDMIVDSGIFRFSYFGNLTTRFGYGVYSIDLMPLFREKNWKNTDFDFSIGRDFFLDTPYRRISLRHNLNENISVFFKDRAISGEPEDKNHELNNDLFEVPRFKKNNTLISLGSRYTFITCLNWIRPYFEAELGIAKWESTSLTMMVEKETNPSYTTYLDNSFIGQISAGCCLIPENLLVFDKTSLTVDAGAGILFIAGSKFSGVYPVISISAAFGTDL